MLGSLHLQDYTDCRSSQSPTLPEPSGVFPPSPVASDEKLSLGVARALQTLRDRRSRNLNKAWNIVQLQSGDYDELWWHLKRDNALFKYVITKVK
jgi:hypothetical protein